MEELRDSQNTLRKKLAKCHRTTAACERNGDLDDERKARARRDMERTAGIQKMIAARLHVEYKLQKKKRCLKQVKAALKRHNQELDELLGRAE